MAIYQYLVTVEMRSHFGDHRVTQPTAQTIADEIDSNLDSVMLDLGIEHFTVEPVKPRLYPGQGFDTSKYYQDANRPAPLSPDGRYND